MERAEKKINSLNTILFHGIKARQPNCSPLKSAMRDNKKKEKGTKPNLDSSDPKSPYYSCSSDNPSNIICPIIPTGKNYAN